MKGRIAFSFYGGKYSHLPFILPHLPHEGITHFVDVFGGSGAIILNVEPFYPIATYNDLDGNLVNFFRCLRDRPDELIPKLRMTPFARQEFDDAVESVPDWNKLDDIERARRYWVVITQGFNGMSNYMMPGESSAARHNWHYCVAQSRRGTTTLISSVLQHLDDIDTVCDRLIKCQIENRSALEVIRRYDSPTTCFYADPPYVPETREKSVQTDCYSLEMTTKDHEDLAQALNNVEGKVVLSGYRGDLYERLYKGWHSVDEGERVIRSTAAGSHKSKRNETLWMNFEEGVQMAPWKKPLELEEF